MRFVAKIHIKTKFETLRKVDATYKKLHLKNRKKDQMIGATITAILIDVENISVVSIWWAYNLQEMIMFRCKAS